MRFEYPRINGASTREELVQIRAFLYGLVERLNLMEDTAAASAGKTAREGSAAGGGSSQTQSPAGLFQSVKALIIKSADIVQAYTVRVGDALESRYVARAELTEGALEFIRETGRELQENETSITQLFSDYQSILSQIETVEQMQLQTDAYIKTGELFTADAELLELLELSQEELAEGAPVYGIAVGQTTNGFKAYARFTPYGLLFYDKEENLVAFITKQLLHIRRVRILESLQRGGYTEYIRGDGSTVEKWEED